MSQSFTVDEVKAKLTDVWNKIIFAEEESNIFTVRTVGGAFIEGLNELLKERVGATYVKEKRRWVIPVRAAPPPQPPSQKPLQQLPAADENERKFAVENLARVLGAVPQEPSWVEEALATVARGVLILLEEKK